MDSPERTLATPQSLKKHKEDSQDIPPLQSGDNLARTEFERRYMA